jgi:predicted kinase
VATLELLVGPIASGKSTYCKQQNTTKTLFVNDDSIVNMVHCGNYKAYDKKLKTLYKSIENQIITSGANSGYNIIVDRPNHTRAMRRRYIGLAKSFDMTVNIILFSRMTPITHAFRRMKSDPRGYSLEYWSKVATEHDKRYQEPDKDIEGFDNIYFYDFDSKTTYDIYTVEKTINYDKQTKNSIC